MNLMKKELFEIYDINRYLYCISEMDNLLILMAIKDNAGYWLNETIQENLHNLGLNASLINDQFVGYVAVIDSREVIVEEKSSKDSFEEYSGEIAGKNIYLLSKPWTAGNTSSIKIDGKDYSINTRGLNIVIFDKNKDKVVDRVVFDTHVKEITCKHLLPHYDVALVGCWWGANYGSCLNGYAVYRTLKSLSKRVLLVNKHDVNNDDWELNKTHNYHFMHKYYDEAEISPLWESKDLYRLNDTCDCFISGSDQIWNYNIFKNFRHVFMLKFVNDTNRRISFGTSFGHDKDLTPKDQLSYQRGLLEKYSAISVRENSGVSICRDVYGLKAEKVSEPVFDLTEAEYSLLAETSQLEIGNNKYIFAYILDPSDEINNLIKECSNKLGKDVFILLDGDPRNYEKNKSIISYGNVLPNTTDAADMMHLYKEASFVITDSFHGTAFSIIFNKPFISIKNFRRGAIRFEELLGEFNLKNRMISIDQNQKIDEALINRLLIEPVEFTEINNQIIDLREKSINWLNHSINAPISMLPSVVNHKIYADLERARVVVSLVKEYGIKHIVMSSGTRNVNLARIFEANDDYFKLYNVSDERSAAYFAIGLATKLNETVAICCTSGTAASNYVPGVTEAFYQKVPLLVITSDRYPELHGHMEDQTIIQYGLFDTCTRKAVTLPVNQDPRNMWETRVKVSSAILEINHNGVGPTQINIPQAGLELFGSPKYALTLPKVRKIKRILWKDCDSVWQPYVDRLEKCSRIMIVYGQNHRLNATEKNLVERFAKKFNCVILTDSLSNYEGEYALSPYRLLRGYKQQDYNQKLSPDVIIQVGGMRILNCPLTEKIRGGRYDVNVWRVDEDGEIVDRFRRLSTVFECNQFEFFDRCVKLAADNLQNDKEYYNQWKSEIENKPYDEIKEWNSRFTMQHLMKKIPSGSLLHLAVGNTFYYAPGYEIADDVEVFCNMGTNGIDGCASSFMGQITAADENQLCFLMIGDLSFFYDMNSILNKKLSNNVRILLNNDGGAGLLRYHHTPALTQEHGGLAEGWVRNCGYEYMYADNKEDFLAQLIHFVDPSANGPIFFETILP